MLATALLVDTNAELWMVILTGVGIIATLGGWIMKDKVAVISRLTHLETWKTEHANHQREENERASAERQRLEERLEHEMSIQFGDVRGDLLEVKEAQSKIFSRLDAMNGSLRELIGASKALADKDS